MALRYGLAGLYAVAGSCVIAMSGCSGEEFLRQPVSGFVNLDGQPLANGAIMFYPVKSNDLGIVASGGAMIKNGYFSLPRSSGPIPGDYHVAIRGPAPDDRDHGKTREARKRRRGGQRSRSAQVQHRHRTHRSSSPTRPSRR